MAGLLTGGTADGFGCTLGRSGKGGGDVTVEAIK